MGYEIQISEVGAAEYPLMAVLRETIFSECGHRNLTSIEADLVGRPDIHAVIAHLEGNPVGFKIGYGFGPGVYYSKAGGVLKEYRRQGLASRMQQWQHDFARARGYRSVFFNSFNHFKPMMKFGLRSGFLPFGMQWRDDALAVQFRKELKPDEPGNRSSLAEPLVTEQIAIGGQIRNDDVPSLLAALDSGFDFTGLRRDARTNQIYFLFERNQ